LGLRNHSQGLSASLEGEQASRDRLESRSQTQSSRSGTVTAQHGRTVAQAREPDFPAHFVQTSQEYVGRHSPFYLRPDEYVRQSWRVLLDRDCELHQVVWLDLWGEVSAQGNVPPILARDFRFFCVVRLNGIVLRKHSDTCAFERMPFRIGR
jgi:hypothetical protein